MVVFIFIAWIICMIYMICRNFKVYSECNKKLEQNNIELMKCRIIVEKNNKELKEISNEILNIKGNFKDD